MTELYYSIADEIFARFSGYARGVVLAYDVKNGESPSEVVALLREGEASVRRELKLETIAEHPRIKSWREAFRSFGAKPSDFRSSIEAMARRALRNDPLPSINALVDIGNAVSLRYLVPTGGHAIDGLTQDISLRLAKGDETFTPFGSDQAEPPLPGEIIFAEGNVVLTRRWTWRQSNHTLTLPTTTAIEYNVDGLPPISVSEVEEVSRRVMDLIRRFCGGRTRYEVLTREHPRMKLTE
ncbi:MAG: phenylalanine--tRNA ligase beta subunit-related protein [Candidatus Aminicenantes bacterium]|nr:phenylalanine--tRNA ligase beta subunit-related protein [Candidatus Aminicenantes bacterium]